MRELLIDKLNISDDNKIKFILLTGGRTLPGISQNGEITICSLDELFSGLKTWPDKYVGYRRFYAIKDMLTTLNLPYETGNDAPRGGKNGNWIKLKNW